MLGFPQVKVELTEDDVTTCIDMGINRYMYYRTPEPNYYYFPAGAGEHEYMLPTNIPKSAVIDVTYQPHSDLFAALSGSGESFFLTYYMQRTGGAFLADFYIAMSYKETFERVLGIFPTYEFISHDEEGVPGVRRDFMRIYPRPDGAMTIAIKYSQPLTEEEVDAEVWIRKYSLTWAKEKLGRVRSKYASIPSPTGEMSLDGQQLISEAQTEREALELTVIGRGEPLAFTTG